MSSFSFLLFMFSFFLPICFILSFFRFKIVPFFVFTCFYNVLFLLFFPYMLILFLFQVLRRMNKKTKNNVLIMKSMFCEKRTKNLIIITTRQNLLTSRSQQNSMFILSRITTPNITKRWVRSNDIVFHQVFQC